MRRTYLEKETEGEAGGEGIIRNHGFKKVGTTGLGVISAQATIEGHGQRCGGLGGGALDRRVGTRGA